MKAVDGNYIKKVNRSRILQKIIEHQAISRADLSKMTGLNKATVSVQVSDLLEEELLYETHPEHNSVGRRPILLSINQTAGYILGVDLDYKQIQFTVTDLQGRVVESESTSFETDEFDEIISLLAEKIKLYQANYTSSRYGLVTCVIGVHGSVDTNEQVHFIPRYQWTGIDLKGDLSKELDLPLVIENNANLAALAEKVYHYPDTSHLLSISLSSGIGAGSIVNWEMEKGYHGFAGEMGHMIISPIGPKCQCGNNGCWELYATERILYAKLADRLNKSDMKYKDVEKLIKQKDPITHGLLNEFIFYIAIGLNNIINLYNPGTVVLNSKILQAFPESVAKIEENMTSNVSNYEKLVLSELGYLSVPLGACALGIQRFLNVSALFLSNQK